MRLAVVLALAACSQPGVRGPDRDDTRGGARTAPRYGQGVNEWRLDGELGGGDRVDWVFVDLPGGDVPFHVEVSVTTHESRTGFDSEIYAVDGRVLARTQAEQSADFDLRSAVVEHAGPVYVRVAATDDARGGPYTVFVTRQGPVVRPTPRLSCNQDAFDPANPACKDRCDFKHPDPENPDCCQLWLRCQVVPRSRACRSKPVAWEGSQIAVPLGLADGVFGRPSAILFVDQHPPPVADETLERKRRAPIILDAVKIDAGRSTWELHDPRVHDLEWLRAHATRVEIQIPMSCPV